MNIPPIVALCGNPNSGKSTAAQILFEQFQYNPVDDGGPLRSISIDYLGLTKDQCYTQQGKEEFVELNGRKWQCREVLGELGNCFEEKFGANIIPIMSYKSVVEPGIKLGNRFSLGSCRRDQGYFWASKGGLVIEISNRYSPPSKFEFDRYDMSCVHVTVSNDYKEGMCKIEAKAKLVSQLNDAIRS